MPRYSLAPTQLASATRRALTFNPIAKNAFIADRMELGHDLSDGQLAWTLMYAHDAGQIARVSCGHCHITGFYKPIELRKGDRQRHD